MRTHSVLPLFLVSVSALATQGVAQTIDADRSVHLRYGTFDPSEKTPPVPAALRGGSDTNLWIVQFDGLPTVARRRALRAVGAQVHGYLPENAYVVRMNETVRRIVARQNGVRSATHYHPAFRLEPELIDEIVSGVLVPARKYNIVLVDKRTDRPSLIGKIEKLGGRVDHEQLGSILLEVTLTQAQLVRASRLDEVLWIDRWTPIEYDMDNARKQGGGDYVEQQGRFTGKDVNGHVYEGVEAAHRDFNIRPTNVRSGGQPASHGHCTAGIVFGNGNSNRAGRGMAPDAKPFYTNNGSVQGSRWQVVETLVKTHQVMFTTASWGNARTRSYTSVSADADDIIFDHDMAWTQSQSNAGNQDSRPQAWAKNIFSCGGFSHRNNANAGDDSWRAGNGSTGPAADGRIKPDLSAYYDNILCSDLTGSAGYNRNGDFYTNFGGTSGATPIIAGHNAIAIQMFTDGLFSPQRVKNGTRWQNKPHFTTLKALQIANASQYTFNANSTDNKREHVGWGMPNLKTMYDRRAVHYVVDETDILKQGEGMAYRIVVANGQPELKVAMSYADPAANPSAQLTRINDLTLRVVAPNGTKYWGNAGLKVGNYSTTGGDRDERDTVESVFVQNPMPGTWVVEVGAFLVAQDSHVETSETDADFGLVAVGGRFINKTRIQLSVGSFFPFGQGCPSSASCAPCFGRNWTATSTGKTTSAPQIAILDTTDSATQICGVELYTRSRSGTVDVNVSIYDIDNRTVLPRNRIATARMRVGTTQRSYGVTFPNKVSLPGASIYFIVFDNADKLILPESRSGLIFLHYERSGNSWGTLKDNTRWQFRVQCDRGSRVPVLDVAGKPVIGDTVRIELDQATGGRAAVLLVGASDRMWGALPLPFSFARGCNLLVSGELIFSMVTDSNGQATLPFPLPNNRAFIGANIYEQFFVADGGNSIGVIASNGGRMRLGEF